MAESANIEERTDEFIREYNRLKQLSQLPDNKVIASMIDISSASTLSNILARRQNIKPAAWRLFQEKFLKKRVGENSDISKDGEPTPMQILAVLADAFRAQAEMMRDIRNEMARADTQARMETNLNRVFGGLEAVGEIQDHAIKKILSDLAEIKAKIGGPSKG